MKLKNEIKRFKGEIESRRYYFDLSGLPDREWRYMLQRARSESINKNYSALNSVYSFMCSLRLSFLLSTAIIVMLMFSLFYSNITRGNTASTNNRADVPVVNVSNNSFI